MEKEIKTLWDFLELYMTNYTSDQRIHRIDRLSCFIDNELSDDEIVEHNLVNYSDSRAHKEINTLIDECFLNALANYSYKIIKFMTDIKPQAKFKLKVIFGTEAWAEYEAHKDDEGFDLMDMEHDDDVREFEFNTKAESDAFVQGMWAMDGYTEYNII